MANVTWDRKANSAAAMSGDGCFRFAVLPNNPPSVEHSHIVCGLTKAGDDAPNGVTHGFLIVGSEYCIVEYGIQVSDWFQMEGYVVPSPVEAVVFRIYRFGGKVYYTVGTSPETAYTADGWEAALWQPWDTRHEYDGERYSAQIPYPGIHGLYAKGELVLESATTSSGNVNLSVAFSRKPYDIYGDETNGAIFGAALLGVLVWREDGGVNQPYTSIPAIQGRSGNNYGFDGVDGNIPPLTVRAGSYQGAFAVGAIAAISGKASNIDPFAFAQSYCVGSIPALIAPPESKVKPVKIPAIKGYAGLGDRIIGKLPPLYGRVGDNINRAAGTIPALTGHAELRVRPSAVYGEVELSARASVAAMLIDPAAIPTPPVEFIISIAGVPYGENSLRSTPIPLGLSVVGRVFGERVLPTQPLRFGLSLSDDGLFKERQLPTEPLKYALTASGQPTAEVWLPTSPLAFALGGRLGYAPIAQVFCMNAETGGTTKYTGYAFNSVAKIDGLYYGANENGLFLLDGDADNNEPIAASFGFGQLDFGVAQMKTLAYCYLGTEAGKMRLTIDALVDGKPAQYNYAARQHGASLRSVRFDLGRGMRSNYVMPTFSNVSGQDFEVDTVRFMAAGSSRRIQK